jgi:hypothetical protein
MAQPVWVLSVDLQAKTATFASGMGDAAKGARASFQDIKEGAKDMASSTNYSMMEARHGVMLIGEEFGFHLPRALTSFIASLGPVGAAMEAAFPFLAIIVGATLLLEHLHKLKEEGDKLTDAQTHFGTTVTSVLNGLDDKLLQAGIRTDELNHNHLAALEKELERIDLKSFAELEQSFDRIAKASDAAFAQLKTHWYSWSAGSEGAKHALEDFKTQYESLQSLGKNAEASGLLKGTLEQAKAFRDTMKQATGTLAEDDKALQAQQNLVDLLQAQVTAETKINALKAADKGEARQNTENKMGGEADKLAREQAQQERKGAEEAQKLWDENFRAAVSALQENEREKIDATKQGSAARLAAIDAAIKEEQSKGLQETGFYRGLLTARINEARQMGEEEKKLKADAGKEAAQFDTRMGELEIAAKREQGVLKMSAMRNTERARIALETQLATEEYELKRTEFSKEMAALDQEDKAYENKLKALQDKQLELTRQYENKKTQITDEAEKNRNKAILSAEQHWKDEMAKGLTDVLMRHETFGKMMLSLGDQVAAGMIQNALKSILALNMEKPHQAAAAGRMGWLAGMRFPFPADLVMAPLLAAAGFTAVMAYEGGGMVPGTGRGDVVPAMLEPGETVLPKKLTEGLMRSGGNAGGGNVTHVQAHFAPVVHAVDAEGVDRMLRTHADTFHRHFASHVRRMNR